MLYVLFPPLADQLILFNLFRYISFRAGAACLTALLVSFLLGPSVIRWLRTMQKQGLGKEAGCSARSRLRCWRWNAAS